MTKLNQIVAVANGEKTKSKQQLTELYKSAQRKDDFEGMTRIYKRLDEEHGDTFPSEGKNFTESVNRITKQAESILSNIWDVIATQDKANCEAAADIIVDDNLISSKVPITTLLYLEKQLVDVNTLINYLPTLSPIYKWTWDENSSSWATEVENTIKTKKIPKVLTKAEATKEHPAQTEVYHDDVKIGKWDIKRYSTAITLEKKNGMLERVDKLKKAVKFAREEANNMQVEQVKISEGMLNYIFN